MTAKPIKTAGWRHLHFRFFLHVAGIWRSEPGESGFECRIRERRLFYGGVAHLESGNWRQRTPHKRYTVRYDPADGNLLLTVTVTGPVSSAPYLYLNEAQCSPQTVCPPGSSVVPVTPISAARMAATPLAAWLPDLSTVRWRLPGASFDCFGDAGYRDSGISKGKVEARIVSLVRLESSSTTASTKTLLNLVAVDRIELPLEGGTRGQSCSNKDPFRCNAPGSGLRATRRHFLPEH